MSQSSLHRPVTAQDVAERAGVSRSAVSRTFSNNGSVAQATREKVLKAAEELGYQVNMLAQSMNKQRSTLIGVVTTRLSDPFRSELLERLLQEIQQAGFQALVTEINSEDELEPTLRRFTQFRVSGVIVTSGQPPSELVAECVRMKIPVVAINRESALAGVDIVKSDNRSGAAMAANQLLAAGCCHLAWVNVAPTASTWSGIARAEGFRQALNDSLATNEIRLTELTTEDASYEGGRLAAYRLCHQEFANDSTSNPDSKSSKKPDSIHKNKVEQQSVDGVFCANAQIACGFLDGMREHGKDAPKDFQLIGFDDTPQTRFYSYQLSTLKQNIDELARKALHCLQQRTKDPERPQRVESVSVELLLRNTSPNPYQTRNPQHLDNMLKQQHM
ncbi:LacI family DNA-binding transcriptional regulator [Oceanospirillum sp.]|uniref:LacI family DNA-binding transcriptional regulator n=1 Tax=Oceanospirillum sp. TaxID=2021254 RepID=UPI003A92F89B